MARRLGRSGERRFATLVADYEPGATCNGSVEDENGWDHVVEFDAKPIAGLPADLAAALPACFVQTKTKAGPGGLKVVVKLSNALAFTRSNNPCFVVLVSSPADGPARYHAVHWWDVLMARSLKRARELHRDGVGEELFHKREISFTMRAEDARPAEELVGWMAATVRGTGRDYAAGKAALRDGLGFEGGDISGAIRIGPMSSVEDLIDHQLGLTPSIPMERVILNHRRFGIDIPFPMPTGPATFARLHANPAATCDVRLRGPDGESFTTQGELLVPVIPGLPQERMKYRLRTPVFDLVWRVGDAARFTSSFDTAALLTPPNSRRWPGSSAGAAPARSRSW